MSGRAVGASQRRKGAGGEREVCALLRGEFGVDVGRQLGQARDGGCDILLKPFVIEVKRRKRIANLYEWLDQSLVAAIDARCRVLGTTPVVICRADGKEWLVVMSFLDWAKLAREEIATCRGES